MEMPKDLDKLVNKLGSSLTKQHKADAADKEDRPEPETEEGGSKKKRKTNRSASQIIRGAESKLAAYTKSLQIEQFDLFPGREYPTPFARIPLFIPSHRDRAREIQNKNLLKNDFTQLESSWDGGGVYRSGPPLTVFDEDTFIGMLHLRKAGLSGLSSKMPSKNTGELGKIEAGQDVHLHAYAKKVKVHAGYFMVSELETLIAGKKPPKNGWPGSRLTTRRESIERLGATILKFTRPQNLDQFRGKQIQMLSIDWVGDKSDSCYFFEIHPAVVHWLDVFRTYIDLDIRRQLTTFGKSLHRFLSSQKNNKHYSKNFADICDAIGCFDSPGEAKRKAEGQLKKLVKLGFIKEWSFYGTGRRSALILEVTF